MMNDVGRDRESNRALPLLVNGDRLNQPEFHRRYEEYPDNTRFELIGGTVYMTSPLRRPHGLYHSRLNVLLAEYSDETPGLETGIEITAILGDESEPQPDLAVRILEEYGGQSRINADEYIEGAPELLAEIAYSSRAIDLNQKRRDYETAGVLEYLVLSIEDERLFWFHFSTQNTIEPDRKGILRSIIFPGLWIHEKALVALDMKRAKAVLRRGITSKEHRDFVRKLKRQRDS
jgi:hypothetical protein